MHVTDHQKEANPPERSLKSQQSSDNGEENHVGVEDTLESHEVIELQAFIERKTWIEEKIQFLESLPPIDIFSGNGILSSNGIEIPGLATRTQLDTWVTEHERIEKETEVFDSGDLKKLKKFTKAATERTLSPEDTDLIELTLTTLLALDKLLHLLRDRSESLELLGHRLNWEEHRLAAHLERCEIINALQGLMVNGLLWNPSIYEAVAPEPDPQSASLSERDHPLAVNPLTPNLIFSKTRRFKIGERLTRDVTSLMSRITSLRHNHVATSARILDQIIDNSRSPVPDEMLDKQDLVEDSCVKELETVSKFAMSLVAQWKKADEIYVDTVKDQVEVRQLNERISSALQKHPVDSQDTAFRSLLESLKKRVAFRAHPIQISSFPRPVHVLFPQLSSHNTATTDIISSELKVTQGLLSQTSLHLSSYHNACTIIQDADALSDEITTILKRLSDLSSQLTHGPPSSDADDGLACRPPDLSDPVCLQPLHSSAFLVTLPTLVADFESIASTAQLLLATGHAINSQLSQATPERHYKAAFKDKLHKLQTDLQDTRRVKDDNLLRSAALREIRLIWNNLCDCMSSLKDLHGDLKDALEVQRWRQQFNSGFLPMTPESPISLTTPNSVPVQSITEKLDAVSVRIARDITLPLNDQKLQSKALSEHLDLGMQVLQTFQAEVHKLDIFHREVQQQAHVMGVIRDEVHNYEVRMDLFRTESLQLRRSIMNKEALPQDAIIFNRNKIHEEITNLRMGHDNLQASFSGRVIFVCNKRDLHGGQEYEHLRRLFESSGSTLASLAPLPPKLLPFDPIDLDESVRADINSFSMRLAGCMRMLEQEYNLLLLSVTVLDIDVFLSTFSADVENYSMQYTARSQRLRDLKNASPIDDRSEQFMRSFTEFKEELENATTKDRIYLATKHSDVRDALLKIESTTTDEIHTEIIKSRSKDLAQTVARLDKLNSEINILICDVQAIDATKQGVPTIPISPNITEGVTTVDECLTSVPEQDEEHGNGGAALPTSSEQRDDISCEDASGVSLPLDEAQSEIPGSYFITTSIFQLRSRLSSLNLRNIARSSSPSGSISSITTLPTEEIYNKLFTEVEEIRKDMAHLPVHCADTAPDTDLRSLHADFEASLDLLSRVRQLSLLGSSVSSCDIALSRLLDTIDGCPSGTSSRAHSPLATNTSASLSSPGALLKNELAQTEQLVVNMLQHFQAVSDDYRARVDQERVSQTWKELHEMALDRLNGVKSRPVSSYGSAKDGGSSVAPSRSRDKKRGSYSNLSVSSMNLPPRPGFLSPPLPSRSVSGSSTGSFSRAPSSSSSKRSVSGPVASSPNIPLSRLHNSTFASRQRTTSTSSVSTPIRSRAISSIGREGQNRASPTPSEVSVYSNHSISTASRGRTSRNSLSISRHRTESTSRVKAPRRKYVPNPQNKLDIAVGDVVNKLPVHINIEVVADTWKDQSGKYWIGDSEPKLCFCRILRSQTVMVRVGGGWIELSKFIKDHFADLFRLLPPESPPRVSLKEEKWINSSSLKELSHIPNIPFQPPRTPEPNTPPYIPAFALSTPEGSSLNPANTSPGSAALTPLQFLRRAEPSLSSVLPATPSKSTTRSRLSMSGTPRSSLSSWRP